MSYIRAFIPWIVYTALAPIGWDWAALAGFLVSIVEIGMYLREGRSPDSLILETGAAIFFALIVGIAFSDPHAWILDHHYVTALSYTALALIAWASLAVRKPFTLGIAKLEVPREYWDTPLFFHANVIISTVWAASFTVSAALIALLSAIGQTSQSPGSITVQVAGFVVPMIFTVRYRAVLRARQAAAAARTTENA